MSLLALRDVNTFIGQFHILEGIDLEVPEGSIVALLGRNGAGKTTTLRTIIGLERAAWGERHSGSSTRRPGDLRSPA